MRSKNAIVPWKYMLTDGIKYANDPIHLVGKTFGHMQTDTYHLKVLNMKRMMTRDPDVINHVLQQNNKNYEKSKLQTKNLSKYAGKGLLTTNGEYWLKQRRLIQPGFHKQKIEALIQEMNRVILDFVESLKSRQKEGIVEVDVLSEMTALTLRVVSTALFSSSITDDQIKILGDGVFALQEATFEEVRRPELLLWRKLNGTEKQTYAAIGKIYDLVISFIEKRKQNPNPPEDLLTMLLDSKYEGTNDGMTNQQIVDEILIIFLAGYETTTNALTFTYYLLSQNPEKLVKVREELSRIKISDNPTLEEVMSLDYTRQVISESMRLYPPAWFIDRVALEDDKVKDVKISKGEILALFVYGLHRSEKYWEEPEDFKPERFSGDNLKSIPKNVYLPFGRGPRFCIGSQFAQIEMYLAIYHLFSAFDFRLQANYEFALDAKITLKPKHGLPGKLILRS